MRHETVLRCLLLTVLAAGLTLPGGAQTAAIAQGIRQDGPAAARIAQLAAAGDRVFFIQRGGKGQELWVSRGTRRTTHLVRTFCLKGDCDYIQFAGSYRNLDLFRVVSRFRRTLLWRSDGTAEGTFPLSTQYDEMNDQVRFRGLAYLTGRAGGQSLGLFKTDGTRAGTVLVKGGFHDWIQQVAVADRRLFFIVPDRGGDLELWSSDGSTALRIQHLGPGESSLLTTVGRRLFFALWSDAEARQTLWTSDGTAAGTRPLATYAFIQPADSPAKQGRQVLGRIQGGKIFFVARDDPDDLTSALWTSDGTPAGTQRVTEPVYGWTRDLHAVDDRMVFVTDVGPGWAQIGSTQGTLASTRMVNALCGTCGSISNLWPAGKGLVFFAEDGTHGEELWWTDGTEAGTHLLADLCPGTCSSYLPSSSAVLATPEGILFSATDPAHGAEVWRTNGTVAGAIRLTDLTASGFSLDHDQSAAVGSDVYFILAGKLWVSKANGSTHPVAQTDFRAEQEP